MNRFQAINTSIIGHKPQLRVKIGFKLRIESLLAKYLIILKYYFCTLQLLNPSLNKSLINSISYINDSLYFYKLILITIQMQHMTRFFGSAHLHTQSPQRLEAN